MPHPAGPPDLRHTAWCGRDTSCGAPRMPSGESSSAHRHANDEHGGYGRRPHAAKPVAIRRGRRVCMAPWMQLRAVRAPSADTQTTHRSGTSGSVVGRTSPSSLVEYLGNMWGTRRGPTDSTPARGADVGAGQGAISSLSEKIRPNGPGRIASQQKQARLGASAGHSGFVRSG